MLLLTSLSPVTQAVLACPAFIDLYPADLLPAWRWIGIIVRHVLQ
jgi:hypothetical protein